jgi:hypothetical protein
MRVYYKRIFAAQFVKLEILSLRDKARFASICS